MYMAMYLRSDAAALPYHMPDVSFPYYGFLFCLCLGDCGSSFPYLFELLGDSNTLCVIFWNLLLSDLLPAKLLHYGSRLHSTCKDDDCSSMLARLYSWQESRVAGRCWVTACCSVGLFHKIAFNLDDKCRFHGKRHAWPSSWRIICCAPSRRKN